MSYEQSRQLYLVRHIVVRQFEHKKSAMIIITAQTPPIPPRPTPRTFLLGTMGTKEQNIRFYRNLLLKVSIE